MGLIKAAIGALGGTLADQWKEFFYCDSIDKDTLVVKGQKRTSGRSSNTRGEENIISNGSGIAVADGQCMIIVDQGKVAEVCAEPGEYTYDTSTEPSIFAGSLGQSILQTFATIGKRFTYGGDTGKDQRIYYFNTKEIIDNKFGTPNPFMFRIYEPNINLDTEVSVRCNGIYSYRIDDPIKFYTNVCGNVAQQYDREELDGTLKTEFIDALQPAFAKLSDLRLRPYQIPSHASELKDAMNEALDKQWGELRGITVVSIALNPITLKEEDMKRIQTFQDRAVLRDPTMAAATLAGAQAEAMTAAASNENGAMMGFMGMNYAQQAGGANIQSLYNSGMQQQAQQPKDAWTCACGAVNTGKFCSQCGKTKPDSNGWTCSCGAVNTGKFCSQCGKPKPENDSWTCSCGKVNTGKFCSDCGKPKPESNRVRCEKCGWESDSADNAPKFCPECGNRLGTDK